MPDRTNVLFVMTDQHRGDAVGADPECPTDGDGRSLVHTPNIDHLVADGALFSRAYTPAPACVPARRCLWTGQTQATSDSTYWNSDPWDFEFLLARAFRDAGYQTHLSGKTHSQPPGNHIGFEAIDGHRGSGPEDYAEWLERRSDGAYDETSHGVGVNSWDPRPTHLDEHEHPTTWTTNRAIDFLENRDASRPFFLAVSYHRPHQPFDPPQVYWDIYADRDLPDPDVGDWVDDQYGDLIPEYPDPDAWLAELPPTVVHRARAGYYGTITHIDHQLNRLLDALGGTGEMNDTVIVFTSDHGEMLGDHHHWRKTYAFEGSARVPFVVSFPGGTEYETGRVIDRPVGLEDVAPTILDAVDADVDAPASIEGRSVLRLFEDDAREDWRDYYHGEYGRSYHHSIAHQYLVDEETKYVWFPVTGEELLFDLAEDPGETHDLTADPDRERDHERWRSRLIEHLEGREEGFSDGESLHTVSPGEAWG